MNRRLLEVLNGKGDNYILPFFWQHGEEKELLLEGIERIYESGIRAVCIESRPHPDFLAEGWWRDMDIILRRAKELQMKVWLLDDAHFPSGYVNGTLKERQEYTKKYITHYTIDAVGPLKHSAFMLKVEEDERLLGVIAARRNRTNPHQLTDAVDITDRVCEDKIYYDVPEGFWCVIVLKTTTKSSGRPSYLNTLDKDAVAFFISTVYEPHYKRYANYFGKTFAGFFSDEPEIGNVCGQYGHNAHIGQPDMTLPWSEELEKSLLEKWNERFTVWLSALWNEIPEVSSRARYDFMDEVSRLYGENFCNQIGEWCRSHKVEYIGHVIEDGGSHARLGLGAGHFFRALWGQDMSGIDVVLQQIRPGLDDTPFYRIEGTQFYEGELFHYGLAKLGVSLADLDEKKQGRTMCEIFGAYGWAEGLKLMKWLTNHMLVRGVNHFVPHAFTMKDFPDSDCPPHFYARGNNPQFCYFKNLMRYMNRICHLLSGGTHCISTAVLYTAEAEWMGNYQPFETVAMILARNQIDFDIVPQDYLFRAELTVNNLALGKSKVTSFILPRMEYMSEELHEWCKEASEMGLKLICMDFIPSYISKNGECHPVEFRMTCCEEKDLVNIVRILSDTDIEASSYEPYLRTYHYRHQEGEFYLFFNESPVDKIHTKLAINQMEKKELFVYDAFDNQLSSAENLIIEDGMHDGIPCEEKKVLELTLNTDEMLIIYVQQKRAKQEGNERKREYRRIKLAYSEQSHEVLQTITQGWSFSKQRIKEEASEPVLLDELYDITGKNGDPTFSGRMNYECEFELSVKKTKGKRIYLDLGEVYETAEVWINGKLAGIRLSPPYRMDITELVQSEQKNQMRVVVTNTLVHQQRDYFSMTMPMEPSGLFGPVTILGGE